MAFLCCGLQSVGLGKVFGTLLGQSASMDASIYDSTGEGGAGAMDVAASFAATGVSHSRSASIDGLDSSASPFLVVLPDLDAVARMRQRSVELVVGNLFPSFRWSPDSSILVAWRLWCRTADKNSIPHGVGGAWWCVLCLCLPSIHGMLHGSCDGLVSLASPERRSVSLC